VSEIQRALEDRLRRQRRTRHYRYAGGGYDVRSLFQNGEVGGWWDASDPSTLFQDSAGTTPVTTLGQPVGRILDKSGNGNHLVQGTATARPRWDARSNLLVGTTTLSTQNVTTLATPYTLSFTGTGTVTLSGTSTAGPLVGTGVGQRVSVTFTPTAGTLTLTVSGTVTDAQLEYGPTATQYQRVTTATDYQDIGLPRYLSFDGFDDFLRTASGADINFTSTDEMTVCAGLRKLSDAADGAVYEYGDVDGSVAGSFHLRAPGSSAVTKFQFSSRGTATAIPFTANAAWNAPVLTVATALASISAPVATLRLGGAQISSITTSQGTGNYGTKALFIGRRAGTSLPFNGRLNQLVIRNRLTADGDLANLERFVASKTGVTLP
jgi:hypothetical protein